MAGVAGKSGRKPKDAERKVIETLTPYEDEAINALQNALKEGKSWAVKLFFEYRWGKPRTSDPTNQPTN